jgi:small subunit ribosomal protein S18
MEDKKYDSREEGRGGRRGGGDSQPMFARRRRPRPSNDLVFDYKDVELLKQFVSEHGKIVPRRISHLSAKQQRSLRSAVKNARKLALLPYTNR